MDDTTYPLNELRALIRDGRMLDAWTTAQATGVPLEKWPSGPARRMAAMIAAPLGARRLSSALDYLNWRHDRVHPRYYFHALFPRLDHSPGSSLIPEVEFYLNSHPDLHPRERSDFLTFLGSAHSSHRDFKSAFAAIDEALTLNPEESWIHVQHSAILEAADRYSDALDAAREAVRLRPIYRASVHQCVDVLVHLGRDDEAIEILEKADRQTQNSAFPARLQVLYSEREDHQNALDCLDRMEERMPLMEKSTIKWLAGRRADFHYMAGDMDTCLEWSDRKGEGFQKIIAENLRKPGAREKKRVRLDVPFVRQHSMTCAPATLSALASFWGIAHDHLAIADAICHEGTPWHKERRWAQDNGFIAREFRLTPESLRKLIDRGIPFTLTTQATTSAHLQACIGYDERLGVVLLRDPTDRHFGEMILAGLLEDHPMDGPRCMAMVPKSRESLLDGISLPDEAAYEAYHELLLALETHDRWKVEGALSTLRAVAPGRAITLEGEERVAIWLQDCPRQLSAVESQLAFSPGHEPSLLQKAYILRRLGRWQDLRTFLEAQVRRKDADPIFVSELGELLMEDARLLPRAVYYLRKAVRRRRSDGRVYESLARCRTKQLRYEESARLRRVASSLSPGFEPYARGYFDTCRIMRKSSDGLEFLEERTQRYGRKDSGPWITLAEAYSSLNRETDAARVLEKGIETRPDDGELRLRSGAMMAGWGGEYRSRGLEWMESTRTTVPETQWLRETAGTASFLGDQKTATRCWQLLLGIQPLAIDAWRGLARMKAEEEGEEAAIALLDLATDQHPTVIPLWTLKAEWLAGTKRGPLAALDRAIELDPDNGWTRRERAVKRVAAGDGEGAEADAREAIALDPWSAYSHGILGSVLQDLDRPEEAIECMREALKLDIDYTFAARQLASLAPDSAAASTAISFVSSEMERQVSNGEIVPAYQDLAWNHREPPVLLAELQHFCDERPDLWQTWSARIDHALKMRLDGEALHAAGQLTESFPLLPCGWLSLARVHRVAGRHTDEEKATARAFELSPGWDEAAREHAHVLEMLGRPDDAVAVLKRASRLDPLNAANHGCLADCLRRAGQKDQALSNLRKVLPLFPDYAWGWDTACSWSIKDNRQKEFVEDLRRSSETHKLNRRWWTIAADNWDTLGDKVEALNAITQGLNLDPTNTRLRDQLAYHHWSDNRFPEALAACDPVDGESVAPVSLRGRRAWLLIHSGHPVEGAKEMRTLVTENPDYAWGFSELADWHGTRGEWQDLRDLCTRWLRASPDETSALGYLGRAERELKNPMAAKAAFARAHAVDPEYVFAARQLLDLQIEAGDLDEAAVTLSQLEHYSDGAHVVCDGIELDLKRGKPEDALTRADSLLHMPTADDQVFAWVAKLFKDYHKATEWRGWLTEKLSNESFPAPGSLTAFLSLLPEKNLIKRAKKRIEREPEGCDSRIFAWEHLINRVATKRDLKGLQSLAKSAGRFPELRENRILWNALTRAFVETNAPTDGINWLADWRSRPQDTTAQTFLYIAALHDSCPGKDQPHWEAAADARREGFEGHPDSDNSQALRAGHALHLAVDENISEARNILVNFEPELTTDYYQVMGKLAQAIVAASDGDEKAAEKHLVKALCTMGQYNDLGSVRIRDRAIVAVANLIPTAKGKPRRLRKLWFAGVTLEKPVSKSFLDMNINFPLWPVAVGLYFVVKACIYSSVD